MLESRVFCLQETVEGNNFLSIILCLRIASYLLPAATQSSIRIASGDYRFAYGSLEFRDGITFFLTYVNYASVHTFRLVRFCIT